MANLSNINNKFLVTTGGDVGIGTTSPSTKLHLGGATNTALTISKTGDLSTGLQIGRDSGTLASYIIQRENADLFIRTNNIERMRIDSSGNVGIGNTSPSSSTSNANKLVIGDGSASTGITILTPNNTSGNLYFADGTTGNEGYRGIIRYNHSNDKFQFYTSATQRMTIINNGNVGIGTDSPSSKLDVVGANTSSNPLVELTASGTGLYQRGVRLLNGGMSAPSSIMYALGYADNTRNMGQTYFHYAGSGSTSNRLSMGLHSVDDVFNILGTGNVGIGTTTPFSTAKLQVKTATNKNVAIQTGTTNTTGIKINAFNDAANANIPLELNGSILSLKTLEVEKMHIDSSGNVGIGVTPNDWDPTITALQIDAVSISAFLNNVMLIGGNAYYDDTANAYKYINDGFASQLTVNNSGNFEFKTAGSGTAGNTVSLDTKVKILNNGNVGIGYTNPAGKLSVSNHVTIGTNTVRERLTVGGKVYIEETGVDWNETTPGLGIGTQHFDPVGSGANNTGNAITFGASDASGGATAQAGIYTRSDGTYGTKMYFATTDSYAVGSKTRMMIDYTGNVGIGTTSPDSLLEISKAQASGPILKLKEPTGVNGTIEGGPGNNLGVLGFVSADSSTSQANLIRASVEGQPGEKPYGTGGLLTFNTMQTYSGSGTLTDLIERMRITSTGAISVGSTGTAYGTSGQVLTSNGNTSPSWQTPSAGGDFKTKGVTLATVTSSGTTVATTVNASTVTNNSCGVIKFTMGHAANIIVVSFVVYETSNMWFVNRADEGANSNNDNDITYSGVATNTLTFKAKNSSPSSGYNGVVMIECFPPSMFTL